MTKAVADARIDDAERAAETARLDLGIGQEAPVADILAAVEDLGIPVTVLVMPAAIAGMYIGRHDRAFIFVNGAQAPVRQRFTLAHELGHYVLGHAQRVEATKDLFDGSRDPDEVDANRFAGAFLVPRTALRNWTDRHLERPRDLELAVRAGAFFGVSPQCALIRLDMVGFLRPTEKRTIGRQLAEGRHRGMVGQLGISSLSDELARIREADQLPRFPARMTASAHKALAAGLIDLAEFEEMVPGQAAVAADQE